MQALEAGQAAGGDERGKQSAAIHTAKDQPYPYIDLRVDEHPDPVVELRRIYEVVKVQMLPFIEALPTRKNPKGDLWEEIRGTLIPNPPQANGNAPEGAAPPQTYRAFRRIVEKTRIEGQKVLGNTARRGHRKIPSGATRAPSLTAPPITALFVRLQIERGLRRLGGLGFDLVDLLRYHRAVERRSVRPVDLHHVPGGVPQVHLHRPVRYLVEV